MVSLKADGVNLHDGESSSGQGPQVLILVFVGSNPTSSATQGTFGSHSAERLVFCNAGRWQRG